MNKLKIFVLLWLTVVIAFVTLGCQSAAGTTPHLNSQATATGLLTIKVLDIGQGDAILIQSPGQVTLIDTGDIPMRERLVTDLKGLGITTIDQLIITHPHADHFGGALGVLQNFTVKHVYDSGQKGTTKSFQQYLSQVKQKNIPFEVVGKGQVLDLGGGVQLRFLAPIQPFLTNTDSDFNNNSVVAKLTFGTFSMLFVGDSEQEAETRLLQTYGNELHSLVLKVGHHGSHTSSSPEFLKTVAPETAIISVGENNDYHHPHPSTVKRYNDFGIKLFRTDLNGTVTITTDSKTYQVTKEK
jgi:competence protein ComEC